METVANQLKKHNHITTCEHEIKVCDCCDAAYCVKCEKEWGTPCTQNHYPTYIPYTVPYIPQPVYPLRGPWWNAAPNCSPYGTYIGTGTTNIGINPMSQITSPHAY